MRILVYGDSNSWGYLDDGSGQRYENRWPVVMAGELVARGMPVELVEECLPGRTTSADDAFQPAPASGASLRRRAGNTACQFSVLARAGRKARKKKTKAGE